MSPQALSFSLLILAVFVSNYGYTQAAPANAENANGNHTISPQTRIIDGANALDGQFPWQVAVVIDENLFCGGSIIDLKWILTAGHCVFKMRFFDVTVGSIYSGRPPIGRTEPDRKTITSVIGIPHPLYSSSIIDINDIGLILLPVPLIFSNFVNAIPLPTETSEFEILDLKPVTVSGWGKTSDGSSVASTLKYTTLTVIPGPTCSLIYRDLIMDQKICCGSLKGHSTCNGDSGGPLVYVAENGVPYEVGIVSYGSKTCTHGIPVVFTRVTSFLNFIYTETGLKAGNSPSTLSFPDPDQWNQTC